MILNTIIINVLVFLIFHWCFPLSAAADTPSPSAPPPKASSYESIDAFRVFNVTSEPKVAFQPIGMALSVGAFARISVEIDVATTVKHCQTAADAMKPLTELTTEDTWARTFLEQGGQQPIIYDHARLSLSKACSRLRLWATPSTMMGDADLSAARLPPHPRSRSGREERPFDDLAPTMADSFQAFAPTTPALDSILYFATSPAQEPANGPNLHLPLKRQPRGLGAAAAGVIGLVGGATLLAGVVTMLFGGSTPAWESSIVRHKIGAASLEHSNAIHNMAQRLDKVFHYDHFQLYLNHMADHADRIQDLIYNLERAFYSLQRGQLDPLLVAPSDLQISLGKLEYLASSHEMHLAIRTVGDALLVPAFGLKTNSSLRIILPIPAYTSKLHLHRYAGSPLIVAHHNGSRTLAAPQPQYTTIAVAARSSNHALLNKADLEGCFRIKDTYLCASLPLLFRREDSCLGSLFAANAKAIQDQCSFIPHPTPWHVTRTLASSFLISSVEDSSITAHCPNGDSTSRPLPWGVSLVYVPAGCHAQTPHFLLPTIVSRFAEIRVQKEVDWVMDAPVHWAAGYSPNFTAMTHDAVVASHKLADLLQSSAAMPVPLWHHFIWVGALIIFAVLLCCVFRFGPACLSACRRTDQPQVPSVSFHMAPQEPPPPSAPLAAPPAEPPSYQAAPVLARKSTRTSRL